MPPPRKSAKAAKSRIVRKRLADGTIREYTYAPLRKPQVRRAADTMEDLIREWERSPEFAARAPRTRITYAVYLKPWAKVGHLRVKDIRRKHVLTLRDAIAAKSGNGAATAFTRIAGALFSFAVDREWIEASPATRIRALPGGHYSPWTEEDLARAMQALPPAYQRVMTLAVHTGQRRGDLVALTWAAWDGQSIRLRQAKTGAELVIRAAPELRAALIDWKRAATSTHILTAPNGQPWTAPHLTREMGKKLRAIGIAKNVHGLRKLAAVRLAEAGCSSHEIQAVLGWRTLQMADLYTRGASQERLAVAAVDRLEASRVKPTQTSRKGK